MDFDTRNADIFSLSQFGHQYFFWVTNITNPLTGAFLEKYVLLFDITNQHHVIFYPLATNWFYEGMNIFFAGADKSLYFLTVLQFDDFNDYLGPPNLVTFVKAIDLSLRKPSFMKDENGHDYFLKIQTTQSGVKVLKNTFR